MKIKKGDQIIITLGKDRGKKGKVEQVLPKQNQVLVPEVNLFKRHLKKRDDKQPGGVVEFSRPLALSKVALICPKCNQPTRVGFESSGQNKEKHRICRKCKQLID